jgi:RNA polymerase sigma-70 factor (ECF subfamily)
MPAPPPASAPSDADLLLAIAGQDVTAFEELFDRYAGRIKAFMMRSGASAADADEIAQDVMVSIWRRAATFDPRKAAASTWIYAIARNRRVDLIRRARRPGPDPEDPLFQPDLEPDGLDILGRAQEDARLRASLETLPPEQKAVLVAAFFEGLSHGEVAETLGLPLGTVKSRIRLAFRHLRVALGDDDKETDDG